MSSRVLVYWSRNKITNHWLFRDLRQEVVQFVLGKTYFTSCDIAKLQIKPKSKSNQTKNLERLYNCLVSFLFVVVVVVVMLRTVLMLLWPLKMLTNN